MLLLSVTNSLVYIVINSLKTEYTSEPILEFEGES